MIISSNGGTGIGQGATGPTSTDGQVLTLRSASPNTKTKIQIQSQNLAATFLELGINNTGVNNSDAFITASDTELVLSTSAGEAIGISSRRVAVGIVNAPLSDLTIFQAAGNNKGLVLSGTGVTASSTTEGVALIGGNIGTGNNQLWVVNHVDQGDASKNSFRFITGSDCPLIVGVNNIGTINRTLCLGLNVAGASIGIGFSTAATQASVLTKLHVQAETADTTAIVTV